MASLEEMRDENKKTPPDKDAKDTCALVIRDNRRVRIEDVIDNIGNKKPTADDDLDLDYMGMGGYGRACALDDGKIGGGVVKNPSLPFHLSLYGDRDTRHLVSRNVVIVDEAGRASLSRLGVDARLGVVCA